MSLRNDDVACAVIMRADKRAKWELVNYTLRKSVAFRSAFFCREEEPLVDPKSKAQFAVVLREDWDANKPVVPMDSPAGFDRELIEEGEVVAEQHAVNMAKMVIERANPPQRPAVRALPPVARRRPEHELAQVGEEIKLEEPKSKDLIYTELEL